MVVVAIGESFVTVSATAEGVASLVGTTGVVTFVAVDRADLVFFLGDGEIGVGGIFSMTVVIIVGL